MPLRLATITDNAGRPHRFNVDHIVDIHTPPGTAQTPILLINQTITVNVGIQQVITIIHNAELVIP